jgi:flagellar FliL protein
MKTGVPYLLGVVLMLLTPPLLANEGAAVAAPEPLKFVVNLGNPATGGQVISLELVLDGAVPEINQSVRVYKPKLQHEILLLLSGETPENLRTFAGKQDLASRIQELANKVLHETSKSGIKEVLFTKFLIQ